MSDAERRRHQPTARDPVDPTRTSASHRREPLDVPERIRD
jgi:hypothetical protein